MRILVVEDSRALADGIAEGLRDQGMAVDVAYDGREAAAKLDLSPYQVVVLDRDIPGLHGDTLCRIIADSGNPAMVLMLTAASTPGDRVTGLSLGADDYLPKPFHFPELVLRIRALARRQPAARSRIYRAADMELDTMRHAAARDGRQLNLSAREFAVLEALMRAPSCPPKISSNKHGTSTPTPSPTSSPSPSAGSAANSGNPLSSAPSSTSGTTSRIRQPEDTCPADNSSRSSDRAPQAGCGDFGTCRRRLRHGTPSFLRFTQVRGLTMWLPR